MAQQVQFFLTIKPSHLILYGERTTVCSEIPTRHVNTFCCKKVELSNITQTVYTEFTGL